jgi:hypothetical protein
VWKGALTYRGVAESQGKHWTSPREVLGGAEGIGGA